MVIGYKLSIKDETHTIEQKKYRSMTRGLKYMTHTRTDIDNAFGIFVRFQADLREGN